MAAPQNARWLGCGLTLLLFAAVFLAWTPQCSHAQHISSGVEELELPWWTNSSLLFNASHSIWFLPGALPGLALNFAGVAWVYELCGPRSRSRERETDGEREKERKNKEDFHHKNKKTILG